MLDIKLVRENPELVKENIKKLMWEKVSIVREEKKLNEALKQLQEMQKDLDKLDVSDKS